MSQEKVERYKKEKANRKQAVKREKRWNALRKCLVSAVGIILIGWIGYSVYDVYDSNKPKQSVEINYQAFDDFSQDIEDAGGGDKGDKN